MSSAIELNSSWSSLLLLVTVTFSSDPYEFAITYVYRPSTRLSRSTLLKARHRAFRILKVTGYPFIVYGYHRDISGKSWSVVLYGS